MCIRDSFVGASSGLLFATVFGLDPSFCSALGVSAVLAASTNTPISGTILAMELFGAHIAAFAGIACAVSYLVVGHRSLYPTQVLLSPKSRTFVIKKTEGGEQLVRRFDSISPVSYTHLGVYKRQGLCRMENAGADGRRDVTISAAHTGIAPTAAGRELARSIIA